MLLNKTTGKVALPVFDQLIALYPTPTAMRDAPVSALSEFIRPLGMYNIRASRLKVLSEQYISDPPKEGTSRKTKTIVKQHFEIFEDTEKTKYPSTPVSHLPGSGRYTLDSYRIFCNDGKEWREVLPSDKELSAYLVCFVSWHVIEF
jgi:methyl-CpG-binding domain protein 4